MQYPTQFLVSITTNNIFHYFQMNSGRLRKYSRPPERKPDDLGSSFSELLSLLLLPLGFANRGDGLFIEEKKKRS